MAAEQSVLGGMLLSKDAIADVLEALRPGDFYRPAHECVYEAILDLYGRGEPADPVTVAAELEKRGELRRVGGPTYLITLTQTVPTAANAGYYAKIVADKAILRRLVSAGTRIVQYGYAGADGQDVADVVDRSQAELYEVTERRTSEDFVQLEHLLQPTMDEIDSIASRGGISLGVPTGFAELDEVTNGLHPGQMIIVAARPGVGKALALDTPLATPTGWTTMGAVSVGDFLLDADGRPTRVVAATEVMADRPCYEVEFSDGTVVIADEQHQWLTRTRSASRLSEIRTTAEISGTLRGGLTDRRPNHAVLNTAALELPTAELPVPPYTFGVWLGGDVATSAQINCSEHEIVARIEAEHVDAVASPTVLERYYLQLAPDETSALRHCLICCTEFSSTTCPQCGKRAVLLRARRGCCEAVGSVDVRLRAMGVLGKKHIPLQYLRASQAQRRDLLAGLLDMCAAVTSDGAVKIVLDEPMADSVSELLAGLGYHVHRRKARGEEVKLVFHADDDVFALPSKLLQHKERRVGYAADRAVARYIVDVRRMPSVPVRCVEVDNPAHLYLAGRSMVPTHNSTLGMDFMRSCSVKHGLASVIFSLEMSRTEIVMRLLSAEAKIKLGDMRAGRMSDDDWTRLARRMSEIAEAPLFVDDSPNLTMMEIRAKARRLKQRHDLKLVVVDYLQLMTSGKKVESRQQEVSEFSRSLKLLAKELEVPVVAISQLNRGPEQRTDKRPMVSDLRESGSLEQDADMVILLHRPDAFERDDPRGGEADLILGKHRNGPTATITVAHQLHLSRFVDMARG